MGERTKSEVKTIREFGSINNLVDEIKLPDNLVKWAEGGYFNEQGEFERIRGKKLIVDDSTIPGRVITISQIDFVGVNYTVFHTSTVYRTSSTLVGIGVSESSTTPLEPFIS